MEEVRASVRDISDRGMLPDSALGIACGQTISQPSCRLHDEHCSCKQRHKALEIGTGSVIRPRSCPLVPACANHRNATGRWPKRPSPARKARYDNIEVLLAMVRCPAGAGDFDRIIVTAAMEEIPERLLRGSSREGS